jgi:hypothetical protein
VFKTQCVARATTARLFHICFKQFNPFGSNVVQPGHAGWPSFVLLGIFAHFLINKLAARPRG